MKEPSHVFILIFIFFLFPDFNFDSAFIAHVIRSSLRIMGGSVLFFFRGEEVLAFRLFVFIIRFIYVVVGE